MDTSTAKTTDEARHDLHQRILRDFEESFDRSHDERQRAERCRDYYDGFQWTAEELETLRKRKQPVVTTARLKKKIDSLIGFEKRQRTDPKAFPRTPKHESEAESATDALRFVCDQNRFQQIRSGVAENIFVEGLGAATVGVRQSRDGFDVVITRVPWDRYYRDMHSRERNFSDAAFHGVVVWMDEADALALYDNAGDVIGACYDSSIGSETYDDRPKLTWGDTTRRRIRVLQHRWKEKGVWQQATLCRGGFLRDPQESPYLDENGRPECDLIAVSAYVTRENERYGEAWQMLSAVDEINKRRSKALHRLSVRQVVAEKGAVASVRAARAELAKPDGYVEINKDFLFQIQDGANAGLAQGEMALLAEAKAELDTSGVNPALEGDREAPSGRAQEVQQQAALSELTVPFEALREWSLAIYRASWNRVRQFWTEERWVRVTDDEKNLRWVGMNKPVTVADEVRAAQEEGRPVDPRLALMPPDAVLRIENPVAELDVDILIEDGPDSVTIQSEQFAQLVEMKKADPTAIPTEMVIEASQLRNKDRILERMKSGGIPPQVQQQMQQMQEALQKAQAEVEAAKQQAAQTEADQRLEMAKLALEQQKLEIERFKAETDRMQLMKPPDPPPQSQPQFLPN
jgi:hypothetical protein